MPKHAQYLSAYAHGAVSPADVLAFHALTFGDARMADGTATPEPPVPPAGPPAAPPVTDPAPEKVEVWQDPDKARAEIERLRRENGAERTNAKAKAADEARAELAQTIGKALGLVKDDKTPVDPAEITKQLADAQAAQRTTAVELAVYRTATDHGGDPNALLDSRTFLAKVSDLDPSAADFTAQVAAAVKAAVADNPKLKATAQAAAASTVDHAGGSGEKPPKATSLEEAIAKKMAH